MLFGLSFGAAAQEERVKTAGDLRVVIADTVILKAEAAREQARQDLKQKSASTINGALGASAESNGLPRVSGIFEARGVATATFVYPNGQLDQGVGDVLPGGYRIIAISPALSSVDVQKKGEKSITIPVSKDSGLAALSAAGAQEGTMAQGVPMMRPPVIPSMNQVMAR
ncbi:type IV pilus biogenesis protein PilP [Paraburkholderia humisilvae]|uniref:type IV pilus biogenesis protein PilP n=1 Tax=Paraburkholderia humisilvae TaxID=627669 RepID=UPI0015837089|nr:type IV pilus biogenesis protein PilP [Paraburkholderia humisilvae]